MPGCRVRSSWMRLGLVGCAALGPWAGRRAPAEDPPAAPRPAAVAAVVPSDPAFAALLVDGTTVAGRLVGTDAAGGITLAEPAGGERTVPLDRLVKLARDGTPAPPVAAEGGIVLLPGGDRLAHCNIGAAGDATVDVLWESMGGRLAIPLDAMTALILSPPREPDATDALAAQIRAGAPAAEQLWLTNGDRLDGLFAGLTDKQVAFQPANGKVALPRSGVVALAFNPAQVAEQPPAGPYLEWALLDGSRVGLDRSRVERGQVIGRARFGGEVRFPVGEVARARVLGAGVEYLSDRDVDKVAYESYLGPTRPYRRGLSVAGTPLRLAGQVYDRGIGTQSRTLLAYRLGPKARRFQATVGLDDAAGPLGSVRFKVLVDGKPRFESPDMGAGDPPRAVDVAIEGGKALILITEFGARGDVQDSGDWAEARILQ